MQGHADIPLNDQGSAQAKAMADQISTGGHSIKGVYASDLKRAVDTAQAIGSKIGHAVGKYLAYVKYMSERLKGLHRTSATSYMVLGELILIRFTQALASGGNTQSGQRVRARTNFLKELPNASSRLLKSIRGKT